MRRCSTNRGGIYDGVCDRLPEFKMLRRCSLEMAETAVSLGAAKRKLHQICVTSRANRYYATARATFRPAR